MGSTYLLSYRPLLFGILRLPSWSIRTRRFHFRLRVRLPLPRYSLDLENIPNYRQKANPGVVCSERARLRQRPRQI